MKTLLKKTTALFLTLCITAGLFAPAVFAANGRRMTLSRTNITIPVGRHTVLRVNGISRRQRRNVRWSTSNRRIAIVRNGRVIARRVGRVRITARLENRRVSKNVRVVPRTRNTMQPPNQNNNNNQGNQPDPIVTHTVRFMDGNTVLSTQLVQHGRSATTPTNPTRAGYIFTDWDRTFNNITSNLTINAQFRRITADDFELVISVEEDTVQQGENFKVNVELKNNTGQDVEIAYDFLLHSSIPNWNMWVCCCGKKTYHNTPPFPKISLLEANSIKRSINFSGNTLESGTYKLKFIARFWLQFEEYFPEWPEWQWNDRIEVWSNSVLVIVK